MDEKLDESFARVASRSSGIAVFRHIMRQCGYQAPSVVADPKTGEIQVQSTIYNEARRNLWLELRRHLRHDQKVLIENPAPDHAQADPPKETE